MVWHRWSLEIWYSLKSTNYVSFLTLQPSLRIALGTWVTHIRTMVSELKYFLQFDFYWCLCAVHNAYNLYVESVHVCNTCQFPSVAFLYPPSISWSHLILEKDLSLYFLTVWCEQIYLNSMSHFFLLERGGRKQLYVSCKGYKSSKNQFVKELRKISGTQ